MSILSIRLDIPQILIQEHWIKSIWWFEELFGVFKILIKLGDTQYYAIIIVAYRLWFAAMTLFVW